MRVWFNGKIEESPRLSPLDRGFSLGDGLFETLMVIEGRGVHLDLHLRRLRDGAQELALPLPWSDAEIAAALQDLAPRGRAALRITLSRGPGSRGLLPPEQPEPSLLITRGPIPVWGAPARAIWASEPLAPGPLTRLKSLSRLPWVQARMEAARAGVEEALLRSPAGLVSEASAANLFLIYKGALLTPAVEHGALPGIIRGRLMALEAAQEAEIRPEMLFEAEEVFMSNSLFGLRPLLELEGRALSQGARRLALSRRLVQDCGA